MNIANSKRILLGASRKEAPGINNKGVSLIALIITIIILILLAGIVLNNFLNNRNTG